MNLDDVRIARPCPMSWDAMSGDDRMRFCSECKLNVYNLSTMSRQEATHLILKEEGRVCGRLYRRNDGTVITKDCPVGISLARRRMAKMFAAVAGLMAVLVGALAWGASKDGGRLRDMEPFATIMNWIDPEPEVIMGDICPPEDN